MPWITVVGILFVSLPIVWPFEQVVDPPAEHCADLEPQNLLNIPKLLGTWYGVEFVSHRNMISSQKSDFSCIVIELFELGGSVSVDTLRLENFIQIVPIGATETIPCFFDHRKRLLEGQCRRRNPPKTSMDRLL